MIVSPVAQEQRARRAVEPASPGTTPPPPRPAIPCPEWRPALTPGGPFSFRAGLALLIASSGTAYCSPRCRKTSNVNPAHGQRGELRLRRVNRCTSTMAEGAQRLLPRTRVGAQGAARQNPFGEPRPHLPKAPPLLKVACCSTVSAAPQVPASAISDLPFGNYLPGTLTCSQPQQRFCRVEQSG